MLSALFSMQIVFFTFLRKSQEPNFHLQHTLDIFLFNTFFSNVNNKKVFFLTGTITLINYIHVSVTRAGFKIINKCTALL